MTRSKLTLRPVDPVDAPLLASWDRASHVVATAGDPDFNFTDWDEELADLEPHRLLQIAEVDGQPIGAVDVMDPARERTRYWGDDFPQGFRALDIWIGEADALGKGHGTTMMAKALQTAFGDPEVRAVLIDPMADNRAGHRFYARCGFRFVQERWFGPDHCFVMQITREDWLAGQSHPLHALPVKPGDRFIFYGLLKQGASGMPDDIDLDRAGTFLGPCRFRGDMVDLHGFPGVIIGNHLCHGVEYQLNDARLVTELDAFEGINPASARRSLYLRIKVPLLDPDGAPTGQSAWLYLYNETTGDRPLVHDGNWPLDKGKARR